MQDSQYEQAVGIQHKRKVIHYYNYATLTFQRYSIPDKRTTEFLQVQSKDLCPA